MHAYKTTVHGKKVWRVKYPTEPGKYKITTYKTKDLAEAAIANHKLLDQKTSREAAINVKPKDLAQWEEYNTKLKSYRLSLSQIAQERLKQLEGVKHHETLYNAIAAFLIAKKEDNHSPRYLGDLQARLNKFSTNIGEDTHCDAVSKSVISDFLNQYDNSTTRDNYRRAISVFFKYCEAKHYVSETPVPTANKQRLKADAAQREINILTIDQVTKLLKNLDALPDLNFRAYVIISLFCGVRSAEFRKYITQEGERSETYLTWGDIDLKNKSILISAPLSKCKIRRAIPIPHVLIKWLERWIKQVNDASLHTNSTPIVPIRHAHGYAAYKNDNKLTKTLTPNCLRHSYGTYRTAQVGASKTATEMGNSETVVTRYYANAVPESRANDFFALTPDVVFDSEAR